MADISATFAPNRCFLANTGGTNIFVGCCQNGGSVVSNAVKNYRARARATPCSGNASCTCSSCNGSCGKRSSAARCVGCGHRGCRCK